MYKLIADFRPATSADLSGINKLIESAVMNWPMPNRLKRRSVPVLQYDWVDIGHMDLFVCAHGGEIIGVAAVDCQHAPHQALLHGLYVLPVIQCHGIGRKLMDMAFDHAARHDLDSVLVKAERVAATYFLQQGLEPVEVASSDDYPHQFVQTLAAPLEMAKAS